MGEARSETCTILGALRHAEAYQHRTLGVRSRKVQELPTCLAIPISYQYYPAYTLVADKTHATELYHLPEHESVQYFKDRLRVAKAIATAFQAQKMNYELLGNTVGHLHWHLVPHYDWAPNPQRPIWEHTPEP